MTKIFDIEPLGDVSDDFFLPPAGFAKVVPKSLSEYSLLAHGLSTVKQPTSVVTEKQLSSRVLKNSRTGTASAPPVVKGVGVVSEMAKQVWFWIWGVVIATLIFRGIYTFCRLRRRMNVFVKSLKKDG